MSNLAQLLPISKAKFNSGEEQLCVNMRNVHNALGVGRDYSNWIKDRIDKYGFIEHEDYEKFASSVAVKPASDTIANFGDSEQSQFAEPYDKFGEQVFGKARIDYYFTLDTAKEIAMVENNDRGREIRRYFIACEKELRKTMPNFSDPAAAAEAWAKAYREKQKAEAEAQKARIECAQTQSQLSLTTDAYEAQTEQLGKVAVAAVGLMEQLGLAGGYTKCAAVKGLSTFFTQATSAAFLSALGNYMRELSKELGVDRKRVPDPVWKQVWAYSDVAWEEFFDRCNNLKINSNTAYIGSYWKE